jgi:hypothetical protein
MHLEFTDEQLELRESARATLTKECPPGLVRDVAVGDEGVPAFDSQLTWLGWPALTIDVDLGCSKSWGGWRLSLSKPLGDGIVRAQAPRYP